MTINHRISAGAFVEHEGRLLLVRHRREGLYDFWVAPGGGVQGAEELADAALREVREETGLEVVIGKLVYVEEFHNPETRHCKFWFIASPVGGHLTATAPEAVSEYIVDAVWHTEQEVRSLQVFPLALQGRYWEDRARGFPALAHIGMRAMDFW
jgi:ADP-ribose pyrophosphatase YjhB (NUDIX family)